MLTREEFNQSAEHFASFLDDVSKIYNKRLVCVNNDKFLKFSLDKREHTRLDITIAYSPPYQSPQLFFRVITASGESFLDIDKVEAILPEMISDGEGVFARAIGIDQDPSDNLYSFFVHPCRVDEIMAQMPNLSVDLYLISFWNLYHL